MVLLATGAIHLRKNKQAKKCVKDILKNYLIGHDRPGVGVRTKLSMVEHLQTVLLVMTYLENDLLTANKCKKFFR